MGRQTSKDKLIEALEQHGWTYKVTEGSVTVKDPSKVLRSNYRGTARVLGTTRVPGFLIHADNGLGDATIEGHFTADGSFAPESTCQGRRRADALIDLLGRAERSSVAYREQSARDAEMRQRRNYTGQVRQVAAAYAAADDQYQLERKAALDVIAAEIVKIEGVTKPESQVRADVILERLEKSGAVKALSEAHVAKQQAGEGIGLGSGMRYCKFRDGQPVPFEGETLPEELD